MVVAISIQKNQNSQLFPRVYTVEPGEYLLVVNLAVVSLPRRWRQLNFRHYRSSSFGGCLNTEKASFKSSKDFVVILRLAAAIHCSLVAYIYCTQRCRVGVRANDERKTYNRRYPVVPYVVSPPILPLPYLLRQRAHAIHSADPSLSHCTTFWQCATASAVAVRRATYLYSVQ